MESSLSAVGYQVNPALISFYKTMSEVKGPQIGTGSIFFGIEWAGGSRELLTEILHNEWGFQGSVITDFNLYPYMNQGKALRNGGDFMLTMYMPPVYDKTPADISRPAAKKVILNAAHNILCATVNSNAMNGVAPEPSRRLG